MGRLQNIKISYCEVHGIHAVYRQRISMTKRQYKLFIEKIRKQLKDGVEYGNYLSFPEEEFPLDKEFYSMNLSTSRFLKSMVTKEQQQRFKMDVNSFISIKK